MSAFSYHARRFSWAVPLLFAFGCGGGNGNDGGIDSTAPVADSTVPGTDASGTDASGGSDSGSGTGGRVVVDPANPRWLFYDNGAPLFVCGPGDPEDFLYRGTRNADGTRNGDQMTLINTLAPTGANSIYFQAVRSHGGDGMADHNPFEDSDPTLPLDTDILDQWDTWLTALDQAGVVSFFFIYDDSAEIWNTDPMVGTQEQAFVEALVNRFEHIDRLVWVIAEEYSEVLSSARASDLAAIIRTADDFDHPIAVHQLSGLTFDFPDDPNIDQFAIQHNVATAMALHAGMVTAWGDAAGRYNLNMSEAAAFGTGATARNKLWASALGGAYVMVLGMDIASTATADMDDCGRLVSFMEATNFYEMEPRDDLAMGDTDYVLAVEGSAYIAYADNVTGDMGLRNMNAGSWDLHWLDPTSGSTVDQLGVGVVAGDNLFTPPPGITGPEMALYARMP